MRPTFEVRLTRNGVPDVRQRMELLTRKQVLVGVPAAKAPRREPKVNNALIAYIQDQGSPLQNIPATNFMRRGIMAGKKDIIHQLEAAGRLAIDGRDPQPGLIATGLTAQKAIRAKITTGPFQPLKAATLKARRRRGRTGTKRLIDTGQLRQSINFVIKERNR